MSGQGRKGKMKASRLQAVCALLVLTMTATPPCRSSEGSAVRILSVGEVCTESFQAFGGDVPRSGDKWSLLYEMVGQPGRVGVRIVSLVVTGKQAAMCNAAEISYQGANAGSEKPIAIIKNLEDMRSDAIATVAVGVKLTPGKMGHTNWRIRNNSYRLIGAYEKRSEKMRAGGETTGSHYRFELETAGKRWVMCRQWMDADGQIPAPVVVRAGDINGDGKLDLLLEEGNEHGSWWTLYVSNPNGLFPVPVSTTSWGDWPGGPMDPA